MERELKASVADLHRMSPHIGLRRSLPVIPVLIFLNGWAMTTTSPVAFLAIGLLTGIIWASFAVLTHDALHRTLTGITWYDAVFPRLIAYPTLWFHGLYSELHSLHHKMNGQDLDDPERVQRTETEYRNASTIGRWYVRHQWWVNLFVLGGFGMIFGHLVKGWRLRHRFPRIRRQIAIDFAGITVMSALLYGWAGAYGLAGKAFLLFLLIERSGGAVHQLRSHILHYGLWQTHGSPLITQILTSRNLRTNWLTSRYFNHLNYHSVHHAFPKIPFYALREAHGRLIRICARGGVNPAQDESYFKTGLRCALNPVLIPS